MSNRHIVLEQGEDGRIWLRTDRFLPELVDLLKTHIPWTEREWARPYWKVQQQHLPALRELAQKVATEQGWSLLDQTELTTEQITAQELAEQEREREERIAALLAVLPRLPSRSLALAGRLAGG